LKKTAASREKEVKEEKPPDPEVVKKQLVYVLCIIQFLSNSAFSQLSPFYPIKARDRGISIIWIGICISLMAIMQIVSSFLVGKFLHKIGGREPIIMVGSALIIA
jgi:cyanate permease